MKLFLHQTLYYYTYDWVNPPKIMDQKNIPFQITSSAVHTTRDGTESKYTSLKCITALLDIPMKMVLYVYVRFDVPTLYTIWTICNEKRTIRHVRERGQMSKLLLFGVFNLKTHNGTLSYKHDNRSEAKTC